MTLLYDRICNLNTILNLAHKACDYGDLSDRLGYLKYTSVINQKSIKIREAERNILLCIMFAWLITILHRSGRSACPAHLPSSAILWISLSQTRPSHILNPRFWKVFPANASPFQEFSWLVPLNFLCTQLWDTCLSQITTLP